MNNLWGNPPPPKATDGRSKNFWAIIIGAMIIGAGAYFGLQKIETIVAPESQPVISAQKVGVKSDITPTATCGAEDSTIVTKVIDGDTVVVEGGYHIRLIGMDADEKGYFCYEQAKTRLEDLVLGKNVILEKDKTDLDQYGRCLRYIFIGNINVDVQLVREGLAIARFYEPDVKYKTEITEAEKYAQQNHLGCKWAQ
jgi:endonuclease YncB( thermonuclease family)